MANTLTALVPKLLAQGLLALRDVAIVPLMVNRSYEPMAGRQGSTIDVPIPSAITAQSVTPANTPPSTADIAPTSVAIPLDQWYEAPFYLTDKEMLEVDRGVIPMQASEAVKALANNVNDYLLAMTHGADGFYGVAGTAGTTPFASTTAAATEVRKELNKQLCPMDSRSVLLDPDAEANALGLRAFQDASFSGSPLAIKEGQINRKIGFNWFMHQRIPTHTVGTLTGTTGNEQALIDGAVSADATTLALDDTTLTGTIVPGDVFSVAGATGTYVVTNSSALTAAANAVTGLTFYPPAPTGGFADDAVFTLKSSHVVNVAMHRDAIAFATRPLESVVDAGLGTIIRSAVDRMSGLSLRLEVRREHKRTRWSFDMLYGGKVIRRELGARILG